MAQPELLSRHEKGAWAEAVATAWLLEHGYWVACNFSSQGPFDLMALDKEGNVFIFDVKYITRQKHRGDPASFRMRSNLQKVLNVRLFIVDHEKHVTIEPPFEENHNNGRT